MMKCSVLAMIMAGGRGERLAPLTQDRAKPSVPFAGGFRIIDFTLSNCLNSNIHQICLLPQYKSLSLDRHIDTAWKGLFLRQLGQYLEVIPPQKRVVDDWYRGTADAVYQNLYSVVEADPEDVLILAGDHIYSMDYRVMVEFHRCHDADVTVGAIRVSVSEASNQLGVLQTNEFDQVIGFQEKPSRPIPIPGSSSIAYASMGIYLFRKDFLVSLLQDNAANEASCFDFGNHILPQIIHRARVVAFSYQSQDGKGVYWRDVGTLDMYHKASMEILEPRAPLKLDNARWPIHSYRPPLPPAQFVSGSTGLLDTRLRSSIVGSGSSVEAATIAKSILGFSCHVAAGSRIEESVLLGDTRVGRDVRLYRTIVDKHSHLPDGLTVGFDPLEDQKNGFTVTSGGVTVIPRGYGRQGFVSSCPLHHHSPTRNTVCEETHV